MKRNAPILAGDRGTGGRHPIDVAGRAAQAQGERRVRPAPARRVRPNLGGALPGRFVFGGSPAYTG
ncbi:hypothetical protein [Lysobacter sp. 1R34A]|uniref:hypothetical protein n=1 Tax=Lysobacter sp. 1R34A TaxID=3445786 RepID=UPI003EEBE332